jgi:hypothetical protein
MLRPILDSILAAVIGGLALLGPDLLHWPDAWSVPLGLGGPVALGLVLGVWRGASPRSTAVAATAPAAVSFLASMAIESSATGSMWPFGLFLIVAWGVVSYSLVTFGKWIHDRPD